MKFGVALPTCAEGMAYPLPFADHRDIARLAVLAEELGFDSVLANDHLSTQHYVRQMFPERPPRYYEPLVTLSFCAARTSRIRLMTGVVVLPMRDPVLLAKQVATLDQISEGRLTLGVGVGGYREEFEAVRPELRGARRADLMYESITALRLLFDERRASYDGRYVRFDDVEMYPKPAQARLPIYSSGNAEGALARAAKFGDGWMPAALPLPRLRQGIETLHHHAGLHGRDPAEIVIAPQLTIYLADTAERARERFESSQVHEHLLSLQKSTLRGISVNAFCDDNLIGTPDEVRRRIETMATAGVSELAGLLVVANTRAEMEQQMRLISEELMP